MSKKKNAQTIAEYFHEEIEVTSAITYDYDLQLCTVIEFCKRIGLNPNAPASEYFSFRDGKTGISV